MDRLAVFVFCLLAIIHTGQTTYILRPNRVCPGKDIRSIPVWNAGQCETECNTDCLCKGFYLFKSTCYLKSKTCSDFETRPSNGGQDYVRTAYGSTCPCDGRKFIYIHRQYKLCQGHDITTFKMAKSVSAVKQCQDACSRNCLCKSIQLNGDTCWLKNYACSTAELRQLKPPVGNDYVKIELTP